MKAIYWIVLCLIFISSSSALDAGKIFTICHQKDPKFELCLEKALNDVRSFLKKGSKELKITPMDPLTIPKVKLDQGNGPVSIDSTYTNLIMDGMTDYRISKVKADLANGRLEFLIEFPFVHINSHYKVKGRVLLLPITGEGESFNNYTDVSGPITINFKQVEKNGKKFYNVEKLYFDLNVKKADLLLTNLFNGNKELGDSMHKFLTENWEAVFQETKPAVSQAVSAILQDVASKIFNKFSIDEIFPQ